MKVMGKPGRIMVEISLFASQFGFVCAYIYFIASQIAGHNGIIECITATSVVNGDCIGGTSISKWWFLVICSVIYIPLVFVRKIEVFAPTHIFADIMIFITIITISVYAGIKISDNDGFTTGGVEFINSSVWFNAIGFSVYAFEGIGVIIPIMEVTEKKEDYLKILVITISLIGVFYVCFAEFWMFSFGASNLTTPLITD